MKKKKNTVNNHRWINNRFFQRWLYYSKKCQVILLCGTQGHRTGAWWALRLQPAQHHSSACCQLPYRMHVDYHGWKENPCLADYFRMCPTTWLSLGKATENQSCLLSSSLFKCYVISSEKGFHWNWTPLFEATMCIPHPGPQWTL